MNNLYKILLLLLLPMLCFSQVKQDQLVLTCMDCEDITGLDCSNCPNGTTVSQSIFSGLQIRKGSGTVVAYISRPYTVQRVGQKIFLSGWSGTPSSYTFDANQIIKYNNSFSLPLLQLMDSLAVCAKGPTTTTTGGTGNTSIVSTNAGNQSLTHNDGTGTTYLYGVDTLDNGVLNLNTLRFNFNGTNFDIPYSDEAHILDADFDCFEDGIGNIYSVFRDENDILRAYVDDTNTPFALVGNALPAGWSKCRTVSTDTSHNVILSYVTSNDTVFTVWQRPEGTTFQEVAYIVSNDEEYCRDTFTQAAHGLTLDPWGFGQLHYDPPNWVHADFSNGSITSHEAILVGVPDANTIIVQYCGSFDLPVGHGLLDGNHYFLEGLNTISTDANLPIQAHIGHVHNGKFQIDGSFQTHVTATPSGAVAPVAAVTGSQAVFWNPTLLRYEFQALVTTDPGTKELIVTGDQDLTGNLDPIGYLTTPNTTAQILANTDINAQGGLAFNQDNNRYEWHDGTQWLPFGNGDMEALPADPAFDFAAAPVAPHYIITAFAGTVKTNLPTDNNGFTFLNPENYTFQWVGVGGTLDNGYRLITATNPVDGATHHQWIQHRTAGIWQTPIDISGGSETNTFISDQTSTILAAGDLLPDGTTLATWMTATEENRAIVRTDGIETAANILLSYPTATGGLFASNTPGGIPLNITGTTTVETGVYTAYISTANELILNMIGEPGGVDLSVDDGNLLRLSSGDGNVYSMPETDEVCYDEPLGTIPGPDIGATPSGSFISAVAPVPTWTPSATVTVSSVDIHVQNTSPVPGFRTPEFRTGSPVGPTFAVLNAITSVPANSTTLFTNEAFAGGPKTFIAGTTYYLTTNSPIASFGFKLSGVDNLPEFAVSDGGQNDVSMVLHTEIVGSQKVSVKTYSDGVFTQMIASTVGDDTDIRPLATIPGTWTLTDCVTTTTETREYAIYKFGTNITGLGANTDVTFDQNIKSAGITNAGATTTLPANTGVYEVRFNPGITLFSDPANGFINFGIVDASNVQYATSGLGNVLPITQTSAQGGVSPAVAYIDTSTGAKDFKIRATAATGTVTLNAGITVMTIKRVD